MFCPRCGCQLNNNQRFCSKCGFKVEERHIEVDNALADNSNNNITVKKKKKHIFLRIIVILLSLFIIVSVAMGTLVYFNVIDIPFVSSILSNVGIIKDDDEILDNQYLTDSESTELYEDEYGSHEYNLTYSGQLTVATNACVEPFIYKENGEIVGFDAELIELIADELELDIAIFDMDFDSILQGVETSKADVGIGLIGITDERKKSVDFSNPYFEDEENDIQYGIEVGKETGLLEDINKILNKFNNDGTIQKLMDKYDLPNGYYNWYNSFD